MDLHKHNITGFNLKLDDGHVPETLTHPHDTGQSILILLIFFIVILSLFGVGMGMSYLCYKRALKKRKYGHYYGLIVKNCNQVLNTF